MRILTKKSFLFYSFLLISQFSVGQLVVDYQVDVNQDQKPISPFIYGVNGQDYPTAKAKRQGGNRLTAYNWETNASHAGEDWFNHNDNFLPWITNIPVSIEDSAAIILSDFLEYSNLNNQYSLMTLPMAGYVSADKDGEVLIGETAPSSRWKEVVNIKGSAFSLAPDKTDGNIYVDEEINFLIQQYGNSLSSTGVNAFSLDNEPALWPSTHPRVSPIAPTTSGIISKSIDLANTIRNMDSDVEIYGPALYGFAAYTDFQGASDWGAYSTNYPWFISAYLGEMNSASQMAGERLLDVLDVHWYPEPSGVYSGDTSQAVSIERMQCVRSLWDSSFVENSWIGQWYSPIALIPHLQNSIDNFYPETKIGITEYDYAGFDHISGGIAQAEALGVFGKYGVYFASKWNNIEKFTESAYDLYLNYDGNGSEFGDVSVYSNSSDIENSSIYSASESSSPENLHLIITNKNYDSTITANINLNGTVDYNLAQVYAIHRSDTSIIHLSDIDFTSNTLELTLPALSVYHLIVQEESTSMSVLSKDMTVSVYPNPNQGEVMISSDSPISRITVNDLSGKIVLEKGLFHQEYQDQLDLKNIKPGVYFVKVENSSGSVSQRIIVE